MPPILSLSLSPPPTHCLLLPFSLSLSRFSLITKKKREGAEENKNLTHNKSWSRYLYIVRSKEGTAAVNNKTKPYEKRNC